MHIIVNHTGNRSIKQRRLLKALFDNSDIEEEEDSKSLEELDKLETDKDEKPQKLAQRCHNKEQSHVEGHKWLINNDFNEGANYNQKDFERRFCLRKKPFLKILLM